MDLRATLKTQRKAAENRSATRKTLRLATRGTRQNLEATQTVVRDLSTTGMLIETDDRLEVGEAISVELPRSGPCEATVVWASNSYFGCRFKKPLRASAVSAALLKAVPAGATETSDSAPGALGEAQDLPATLTALRQARGLTGEQLAKRIGVSRQALWYWETGRRTPRPEQLGKVAAELGVTESELQGASHDPLAQSQALNHFRRLVARHYGIDPNRVRIMLEL
jgi:transcriptional regulator with XRE-family HTH domain